ncbi:MAG: glycosyltransferase, partial [Thiotrichaceae bacterium]|nr:glycosyltransferase [Thiotrichaceae bacterium]
TISSVLLQSGDFEIYYHVQDGGSTDGTVELLKTWDVRVTQKQLPILCKKIHFSYSSEPDNGMYDAIVKGFQKFQIEQDDWMTWINADDIILSGAFALMSKIDKQLDTSQVRWIAGATTTVSNDATKHSFDMAYSSYIIKNGLCDGKHWNFLQQGGVFFKYSLWNEIDINKSFLSFKYAADWALWQTFAEKAEIYQVKHSLGAFSYRDGQLSQAHNKEYEAEIETVIPFEQRNEALAKLEQDKAKTERFVIKTSDNNLSIVTEKIEAFVTHHFDKFFNQNNTHVKNNQNKIVYLPSQLISQAIECASNGSKSEAIKLLAKAQKSPLCKTTTDKLIKKLYRKYHLQKEEFVDHYTKEVGVSLVSCCMNRSDNLLKALPSWIKQDNISEIIIVDWSSEYPVQQMLQEKGIVDERIKIVRVNGEPRWVLSIAFNLGFRAAKFDKILKVDADILLKEQFFEKNMITRDSFIAGDWKKAPKGQTHINGFFYIYRDNLLKVAGFNEFITTYGWDDDDLYQRLDNLSLERVCVDLDSIYHIPHDDVLRHGEQLTENYNYLIELRKNLNFKIMTNRYIAFFMPPWKQEKPFTPFDVYQQTSSYIELERIIKGHSPCYVTENIKNDAEYYAATRLAVVKAGDKAYYLTRDQLFSLLSRKPLSEITMFDVEVHKQFTSFLDWKKNSVFLELLTYKNETDRKAFLVMLAQKYAYSDTQLYLKSALDKEVELFRQKGCSVQVINNPVSNHGLFHITATKIDAFAKISDENKNLYIKVDDNLLSHWNKKESAPKSILRRKIYIDVQHGLGNRLRAYASAAVLAKELDRELVVIWTPDKHCNCYFSDLFNYEGTVISSQYKLDVATCDIYNYMEIEEGAEKDKLIKISADKDLYARSAYVLNHPLSTWDKENIELRKLQPTEQVINLVKSVSIKDSIGVHIRMEGGKGHDKQPWDSNDNWHEESHKQIEYWRDRSHYSHFIKRIDEIKNESSSIKKVFLATDLPQVYEALENYYDTNLVYLQRSVYDRSKEQMLYALADILLLSQCKVFLGSYWSSFTELAIRFSITHEKVEICGKDF